jgi:hypothetical protein
VWLVFGAVTLALVIGLVSGAVILAGCAIVLGRAFIRGLLGG